MGRVTFKSARRRTAGVVLSVAVLAGAITVGNGVAVADSATVRDPGTEFGRGINVTRLYVANGQDVIRMVATTERLPSTGRVNLGFYGTRDFVGGNVTVVKRSGEPAKGRFHTTYPESGGEAAPCPSLRVKWVRAKRQVVARLAQSCWADAMGRRVPNRWDFYAQTGDGRRSYDYVQIRRLVRG